VEPKEFSKKENIKIAAKELFFHFGLTKTSMEDIAQQSNLAKPSLYYYYPNKEALFNEIVIDEAKRFMDNVEKRIPQDLPADEKIAFFFRSIYKDLKKYYEEISLLPELLYEHCPHGRPISDKIGDLFKEKIKPLLEAGRDENILEFEHQNTTVSTIVVMTKYLNLDWMRRVDEKERDRIIEMTIKILLNGLRRR
jgi:AcrR family transcriptional regulator